MNTFDARSGRLSRLGVSEFDQSGHVSDGDNGGDASAIYRGNCA